MTFEEKILAALAEGPKTIRELYQAVTYCGSEHALEVALFGLVRECTVTVRCGVYSLVPA